MKYIFSSHTKPSRPLWKAVTYETIRLVAVVVIIGSAIAVAARFYQPIS